MAVPASSKVSSPMTEHPFFFSNGEYRLFGFLHVPSPAQAKGEGFVLCYPEFEEKLWAHRVYVSLARDLANRGYHVLRFDCMGQGDSEGDFARSSITTRLSDLACAVNELRTRMRSENVSLLGLRLGATLAAIHAENDSGIRQLVLWDPVTDGAAYMQEVLLSNLATQSAVHQKILHTREDLVRQMQSGLTVNVEGYELSSELYHETTNIRLNSHRSYSGPCLIVQIGRQNQKPRKNLVALRELYSRAGLVLCEEEPFWKEIKTFYPRAANLFDSTFLWISHNVS